MVKLIRNSFILKGKRHKKHDEIPLLYKYFAQVFPVGKLKKTVKSQNH